MSTAEETKYMTVAGLKTHPLFNQLTDKQKVFLLAYMESGNKTESAQAAYDTCDEHSANQMANRLLNTFRMRELLALYYGYKADASSLSRLELVNLISKRLRNPALPDLTFRYLSEQLMTLKGWRPKQQPKPFRTRPKLKDESDISDVDEMVLRLEQEQEELDTE